ncbi:MAG: hypothetical protein OXH75_28480 [Acidobacteria bacterium]|nr:hypothetical protein [Acidobacteriota bacterium]
MRSTVRIDDDLMLELKQRARDESVSLTRMLNRTLRAGLFQAQQRGGGGAPFRQQSVAMGAPRLDIDKALALAARLEDEEVARELSLRK